MLFPKLLKRRGKSPTFLPYCEMLISTRYVFLHYKNKMGGCVCVCVCVLEYQWTEEWGPEQWWSLNMACFCAFNFHQNKRYNITINKSLWYHKSKILQSLWYNTCISLNVKFSLHNIYVCIHCTHVSSLDPEEPNIAVDL